MILAEDSLVALNKELHLPMEMERFRPNIVVTGLRAFEEVSSLSTNVFLTLFLGGCFLLKMVWIPCRGRNIISNPWSATANAGYCAALNAPTNEAKKHCCGSILLLFPRLRVNATFVVEIKHISELRNIYLQQMFPACASKKHLQTLKRCFRHNLSSYSRTLRFHAIFQTFVVHHYLWKQCFVPCITKGNSDSFFTFTHLSYISLLSCLGARKISRDV